MKTSLGVIRACAEGLQDEADEEKKQREWADLSLHCLIYPHWKAGRLLADIPAFCFTLQYELPESEVYVLTDRQRMEQVLNNLIINAKKNVLPGER